MFTDKFCCLLLIDVTLLFVCVCVCACVRACVCCATVTTSPDCCEVRMRYGSRWLLGYSGQQMCLRQQYLLAANLQRCPHIAISMNCLQSTNTRKLGMAPQHRMLNLLSLRFDIIRDISLPAVDLHVAQLLSLTLCK